MKTGDELSRVREVQILSQQKSPLTLSGGPNLCIDMSGQILFMDGVNIMPHRTESWAEAVREILIQLEFHRMRGVSGVGRSFSAEAARKAMAACMSSSLRLGKSARIC